MKPYLEVAKIVTTHGIHGEVKAIPLCDSPEQLCDMGALFLDDQGGQPATLERARVHKNTVILKLAGVNTPEEAHRLRNRMLYAAREEFALAPGSYFIQDLIGLTVLDADSGQTYGTLCDVTQTGANDVYHVRFADGGERYVPAIADVVLAVDLAGGTMQIRPLKGLFDDDH